MRCNVDLLKIIQVGITFSDEEGNFPQECSTWQFNFKFSVKCVVSFAFASDVFGFDLSDSDDMYSQESLEPLQKAGFDFQRHEEFGILPNDFAELMITSGLVLVLETKWISFHRFVACHCCFLARALQMLTTLLVSAYDFGYFVKLLTAESLPTTEEQFFTLLRTWFPTVYDVKCLMRSTKVLRGTLQELADDLGVRCFRRFS